MIPYGERHAFRQLLAGAHGCSVELVRKWAYYPPPADWGADKVKRMSRPHPASLDSVRITEELTGNRVTRYDLRPEIYERKQESSCR